MQKRESINYIQILILLFLLGGVYLGYANMWFCVIAFIFALIQLNKEEFIFVMLMTGAEYFGVVVRVFAGSTIIPQFIGYLLVLLILSQRVGSLYKRYRIINNLFFVVLFLFVIAYLYGPQHAYSNMKLVRILLYGILCFWTFLIYNKAVDVNSQRLAYIFSIVAITYIVIGVTVYNFGHPSSILDFEYFGRVSFDKRFEDVTISYHSVGLAALYGVAFLLSPVDDRSILNIKNIGLLFLLVFIALVSQMRQGLVGILVLLCFRYIILVKGAIAYRLIGVLLLALIGSFLINDAQTESFQKVGEATTFEEAVNRSYDRSLMIIDESPFFGEGLGGYSSTGEASYPHNVFLEIVNELGFVGLFIILILSFYVMRCNHFSINATNANGTYVSLLLLAIFIRVNASGDLSDNIYFFSLLFATSNVSCGIVEMHYRIVNKSEELAFRKYSRKDVIELVRRLIYCHCERKKGKFV